MSWSDVGDHDLAGGEGFCCSAASVLVRWFESFFGPVSCKVTTRRAAVHAQAAQYMYHITLFDLVSYGLIEVFVVEIDGDPFSWQDAEAAGGAADRQPPEIRQATRRALAQFFLAFEVGCHAVTEEVDLELFRALVPATILDRLTLQEDDLDFVVLGLGCQKLMYVRCDESGDPHAIRLGKRSR